ncbi:MAG: hypothetical protein LBG77_03040 [Dysgonamonadaceae bacterium]|nr:hypothetical protein [Dysgonamonadaceae bacterium]
MRYLLLPVVLILQIPVFSQVINYSSGYFGPNAMPVPEFGNGAIPAATTISLAANYYFGFGDQTFNPDIKIEIPLLPKRISIKLWAALLEYYSVTQQIYDYRGMQEKLSGLAIGGDIYIQTRISIFAEKKYMPAVIINSTLKSASSATVDGRRYFDTPGYYFDLETAKSFHFSNKLVNEIRLVANFGFLCWETTDSRQNDAFMHGVKFVLSNNLIDLENTLSGYDGWMDNGDHPIIYSIKLTGKFRKFSIFARYQYGIRDFPYHYLQAGASMPFEILTPAFCR